MISLCLFCKERNKSSFPECRDAECYICKGASSKLEKIVGWVIEQLKTLQKQETNLKSFSISTIIPREILSKEEDVWDFGLGESIKNAFNKIIVNALVKNTGLDYDVLKADKKITFDIATGNVIIENSDLFIFGRYKKLQADISQTEWTCKNCNGKGCDECDFKGVKYSSVEAIIGKYARKIYHAKDAELHASGREDIDVLNTAGRPFVLELKKPNNGKIKLEILKNEVNNSNEGVEISDLKYVSNSEVALVSDSHFDKMYEAEIKIKEQLSKIDIVKILQLRGVVLHQQTPQRVKHRRCDIIRKRKILDIFILNKNPLKLHILAEAGTYIKEFITGDEGRTKPSITSVLRKEAKCVKLTVIEIHDEFLTGI